MAAACNGQFFGAADRIRRRMDDALVSGSVTAIMLDEWEEATVGYGRQYMTASPLRLLCDVLLDLGDVRRMSERRQPLEFSERLCRLAGLAEMIMIDVGHQRILDRSLITLGLARCRLEADEPDEALRLSRETVLTVPRAYRSEIMVRIARSLGESVAARHGDARAVRDYREALISG
jgi:hypothetical protein